MAAKRSGAGDQPSAQDALKAPRMAQGGLQHQAEPVCPVSPSGAAVGPSIGQGVYKPPVLEFEPLRWGYGDVGRHNAVRSRFLSLVKELCRKRRREFPAYKYLADGADGLRERASLLRHFGGLPETVEFLVEVPTETLEEAVGAFAFYFGLGDAASGHLEDAGTVPPHLDPTPPNRGTLEVPW